MEKSDEETEIIFPINKEEAEIRKLIIDGEHDNSNLEYSSLLILNKRNRKKNSNLFDFYGKIKIKFFFKKQNSELIKNRYFNKQSSLFLNFNGYIHYIYLNGEQEDVNKIFINQKIFIDLDKLIDSAYNHISVIFSGNYTQKGRGLHYYKDPFDNNEYLYSQFETFDCNRVFPSFDQPDIKGKMSLSVVAEKDWLVLSNEFEKNTNEKNCFFYDIINNLNYNLDSDSNEKQASKNYYENLFTNDYYNKTSNELKFNTKKDFLTEDYFNKTGLVIHCFNQTEKISSYLYAICAGPYHEMLITEKIKNEFNSNKKYQNNPPIRIFCRQSLKNYCYADKMFNIIHNGIIFYENYFGLKFPFKKIDKIFVPEFNFVACENVGLVTYDDEKFCFKEPPTNKQEIYFAIIILHELSHMWFGNLITMNWWDDLWLNESFATFISFLCLEKSENFSLDYKGFGWEMFNISKDYAYRADDLITTHPIYCDIKDTFMAENNFDDITYEKGSAVLKQLYKFLGDELFSSKLKVYFQKYKWKNTTFKQFIEVLTGSDSFSSLKVDKFNFYDICLNWLTKAGLSEIKADILIENFNGKNFIKDFFIKQLPLIENQTLFENEHFKISEFKKEKEYFYELNNLQTHLIDILFIYDFSFDNELFQNENNQVNKNLVFNDILIKQQKQTQIDSLKSRELPKIILLNYNDFGFFKWIIDENSLDYLKKITEKFDLQNFIKDQQLTKTEDYSYKQLKEQGINDDLLKFYQCNNSLCKLIIFKALYDMVSQNKLKFSLFIDLTCKLILFEKNENIVNVALKRLTKIAKYSSYAYTDKNSNEDVLKDYVFNLILFMLKNNLKIYYQDNQLKNIENLIKIIYIRFLKIISKESEYKKLFEIIKQETNKEINIKNKVFFPKLYAKSITKIFESKEIDKDLKYSLLNSEKDNLEINAFHEELVYDCEMKLPDKLVKRKIYNDAILNNKENFSLQAIHNVINNFYCANQEDILFDFYNINFFDDYEKIINKNDIYLTTYYINKLSKFDYTDKYLISKLFQLAKRIKYNDVGFKMLIARIDKVNKIQTMIFNN